jgi:hypothetical protein
MGAAEKLKPEPSEIDFTKPVPMRWWRLPRGEFIGNTAADYIGIKNGNLPASALSDGVDVQGVVESIVRNPDGLVVVQVRCGAAGQSAGEIRTLAFDCGGQGAPL